MPSSDAFIGEIYMAAFQNAPRNFAACNGAALSIYQFTSLFALIGTNYGGDGQTTFNLPDLRGRVPIGIGTGPGLSNIEIGQRGGAPTSTLTVTNLPAHTHTLKGVSEAGNTSNPTNAYPAGTGSLDKEYNTSGTAVSMNAGAVGSTGGSQSFSIRDPYLGLNFYICLNGIYPSFS